MAGFSCFIGPHFAIPDNPKTGSLVIEFLKGIRLKVTSRRNLSLRGDVLCRLDRIRADVLRTSGILKDSCKNIFARDRLGGINRGSEFIL
jgi:hypothetical protein